MATVHSRASPCPLLQLMLAAALVTPASFIVKNIAALWGIEAEAILQSSLHHRCVCAAETRQCGGVLGPDMQIQSLNNLDVGIWLIRAAH